MKRHRPKPKNASSGCNRRPDRQLTTYDDLVNDYIAHCRDRAEDEREFFKVCSFKEAIRNAGRCMMADGKRHAHHRRRSTETLMEVESVLQDCAAKVRSCDTFDALHELIDGEIRSIHGVGPLMVYDITTSIGANRGLGPKCIYLHRGTTDGARSLMDIKGRATINREELPAAFKRLRCYEIEDCLCIYADDLARIARERSSRFS